jgi:alcohol dehydrogenase, propanol-preferring
LSPCGACYFCQRGRRMDCPTLITRPVYGITADGGFEEYCRVNAKNLVKVPEEVSFDFAASLADAGMTAYHAANSTGKITEEDNVLIYGVGGVATYAIQLAKLKGAKVIAVSRTPAKLEMARKMGSGTKEELAETLDLAKNHKLKSPVTRKAGLEEINQVLEDLRQGKVLGRACVAF